MLNRIIPVEYLVAALGLFSLIFVLLSPNSLKLDAITSNATLNDYWSGNATFNDYAKLDYEYRNGTSVKVVNGVWYLFYRGENNISGGCNSWLTMSLDTRVVQSNDKGKTWSNPVTALPNELGTPWECSASDGDAYYDSTQNKWHMLVQCANADRVWHGCHFVREGASPMGQFHPEGSNPVLNGNDLWRDICNSSSDECNQIARGNNVREAGTFDIFQKANGYFYIGFHGAYDDSGRGVGFRGLAKTADWTNWIAGSGDLPTDSIFDQNDSASWREDWQGFNAAGGAGNILYDSGNYYLVVEAAAQGINCLPGQHWDAGILRSSTLTNTHWEQIPTGNPIVYSYRADGKNTSPCPLQYMRIFRDDVTGKIYMHYSQQDDDSNIRGVFVKELIYKASAIPQVDPNIGSPVLPTPAPVLMSVPLPIADQPLVETPTPTPVTVTTSEPVNPIVVPTYQTPYPTPSIFGPVYGGSCNDDCFSDDLRTNVGNNPSLSRCDSGYQSTSHFCNSSNAGATQACGGGNYRCVNGGASGFYWYPAGQ